MTKACRKCGEALGEGARGQFCSGRCLRNWNSQIQRRRHQEKRSGVIPQVPAKRARMRVEKTCEECGQGFVATDGWQAKRRYCSDTCAARARRKMRAGQEAVSIEYLHARDGGRCRLCGGKVDMRLAGTLDPLAPTRDHIVPVTQGGGHGPENMQLAHRRCNGSKGHRSAGEQLMLVG